MSSDTPDRPDRPDRSDRSDRSGDSDGSDGPDGTDEWWVDRFILYSVRESMLWALLLVVLAHIAGFVASALLATLRTGHPAGVAISLMLVGGTAASVRAEVRRKGKPAGLTWLLLATWLLSGLVAWAGDQFGLL